MAWCSFQSPTVLCKAEMCCCLFVIDPDLGGCFSTITVKPCDSVYKFYCILKRGHVMWVYRCMLNFHDKERELS